MALILATVVALLPDTPETRPSPPSTASLPSTAAPASDELRWIAPAATGSGDGSAAADAADLSALPRLVSDLPEGGRVRLMADQGAYEVTERLILDAGGIDGSPVVVEGVDGDGRPATAMIQGDRTSPYRADGEPGTDTFTFERGASHLVFRDLALQDVGNAFRAAGDVDDLVLEDVTATNVRRFFENAGSDEDGSADVTDLTLRRITVTGFSKRVLRLRNDSHGVLVEDVVGDSQQQDGDDFAIGVHLEDTVHDVVLRRVRMDNTRDTLRDYWNGDGFATERDVSDVRFENTSASGNTDAGYDLKSSSTVLVDAVARDNKRNFRFWADDIVARGCEGVDPRTRGGKSSPAQVWLGEDASATLEGCTFRSVDPDVPVFIAEPNASAAMVGGTIVAAGDLERTEKGATVDLRGVTQREPSDG